MADIPHWDLVSWTLDNADIEEDRLVSLGSIAPGARRFKHRTSQPPEKKEETLHCP